MTVSDLNELSTSRLKEVLFSCCGSSAWVSEMATLFPVDREESLFEQAGSIWFACSEQDWREAFSHHPKIGDINSLREKFPETPVAQSWAEDEQASVAVASEQLLEDLAEGNRQYEAKFGYIFIVCATGKSAGEMLEILNARLPNSPENEILIAMQEQHKITKIRLEKLLAS